MDGHGLNDLAGGGHSKDDTCMLCPVIVAGNTAVPHDAGLEAFAPSMPPEIIDAVVVVYRSVGCGIWGTALRSVGMPLEKIAMITNSGQVRAGSGQLAQAVRLTFANGALAPYRVIGPASITAWFLQYSCMSFVFQLADSALSLGMQTERVVYGDAVYEPPAPATTGASSSVAPSTSSGNGSSNGSSSSSSNLAHAAVMGVLGVKLVKDVAAAGVAGVVESAVSNRAEAQRFLGIDRLAALETQLRWNPIARALAPGFMANISRNAIMAHSAFVMTPILYKNYVPQEHKVSQT